MAVADGVERGPGHPIVAARTDQRVNPANAGELVTVALHHAAGHDQPADLATATPSCRVADRAEALGARRLEKPARIDDDDIRSPTRRRYAHAALSEQPEDLLGVHYVLGAAQID